MDLVTSADVGTAALDRLVRERLVVPLSPGFAAPLDLPITREDRVVSLQGCVPAHTIVSGLGGRWIHLGGRRPPEFDLVGARGLHRTPPGFRPTGLSLRFHSGRAATEPCETIVGVRVAGLARCLVDGLRWGNLADAILETAVAIRAGQVGCGDVAGTVAGEDPKGPGAARLRSAWAAIEQALG